MIIIPVMDLSSGIVVHAKHGQRNIYQPIKSALTTSSKPEDVLSSILELYPFKIIYIADLDAIQRTGTQNEIILKLASHYKECEFWVDASVNALQNTSSEYSAENIRLILGSEDKLSKESLSSLVNKKSNIILSLDFNEHGLIENSYLLKNNSIWPEKVIVMMLSQVGSNKGINKQCLNNILSMANDNKVYAAGGVRNKDDLSELKSMSIDGALIATALHTGAISKEDLYYFLDT
jgi:phosphoribosylformimino-5-aminoimidazole carboxamide ribotide isomerase